MVIYNNVSHTFFDVVELTEYLHFAILFIVHCFIGKLKFLITDVPVLVASPLSCSFPGSLVCVDKHVEFTMIYRVNKSCEGI